MHDKPPADIPHFVLFLTGLDDEMNADRAALRRAGVLRQRSIRSGQEALRILRAGQEENAPFTIDFIVCAEAAADINLKDFLHALREVEAESSRPAPPVLYFAPDAESARRLQAWGATLSLPRPYSTQDLMTALDKLCLPPARAIVLARSSNAAPVPEKIDPPAVPAPPEENTLLYGRQGIKLLLQGQTEQARKLLHQALIVDPLDVEAALGLSRLYRSIGDEESSWRWQHRAGVICLDSGQKERAELIFARLPAGWQGDPYQIEGRARLQEEDFDGACEIFMRIHAQHREISLPLLLGRACQFTSSPEYFMQGLCDALERHGYAGTARKLGKRLLANVPDEDAEDYSQGGILARFPKLQEILAVMRFTLQTWHAGDA